MRIPGVIGTAGWNGAGKDTLADVLVERLGERDIAARHISGSDALRMLVREEHGMAADEPVPRELLGARSDRIVRERGHPGGLVLEIHEKIGMEIGQLIVVSSIRRVGEAEAVQVLGGFTAFAHANPLTRLSRLSGRDRGDEAIKTMADLQEAERKERYGDPERPKDPGVMCIQDVYKWVQRNHPGAIVLNEGTLEDLGVMTDQVLDRYLPHTS